MWEKTLMSSFVAKTKNGFLSAWVQVVSPAVFAVVVLVSNASAVVIDFETSQGFPDGDATSFAGSSTTYVDAWLNDVNTNALIDHGPGGGGFGDEPNPISGSQIGLFSDNANTSPNTNGVTVDLVNASSLYLESFWYANRGTWPPEVTVEYFGLDEVSLGSESFSGSTDGGAGLGLNAGFGPEFDLVTVSLPAAIGTPLSKFTITSGTTGALAHGSFSLDDITLVSTIPEPTTFALLGMATMLLGSGFRRK